MSLGCQGDVRRKLSPVSAEPTESSGEQGARTSGTLRGRVSRGVAVGRPGLEPGALRLKGALGGVRRSPHKALTCRFASRIMSGTYSTGSGRHPKGTQGEQIGRSAARPGDGQGRDLADRGRAVHPSTDRRRTATMCGASTPPATLRGRRSLSSTTWPGEVLPQAESWTTTEVPTPRSSPDVGVPVVASPEMTARAAASASAGSDLPLRRRAWPGRPSRRAGRGGYGRYGGHERSSRLSRG